MNGNPTKGKAKKRTLPKGVYERGVGTAHPYFQVRLRSKGQNRSFKFPYVPVGQVPTLERKTRQEALDQATLCKAEGEALSHYYDRPLDQIFSEYRLREWVEGWIQEACERKGKDGQPLSHMIERKGAKEDAKQIRRLMFIADAYAEQHQDDPTRKVSIFDKRVNALTEADFTGKHGLLNLLTGRAPKRRNPKVPEPKPEASAATKRRALALLSMVWAHVNEEWRDKNQPPYPRPWEGFQIKAKQKPGNTRALSIKELSKVERAMEQLHPTTRAAIHFLRWTAARAGEMKKLEWQHVTFAKDSNELGELLFVGTKTPRKGAYRERRIPLPEAAEEALRTLFNGQKPEKGLVFRSPSDPHSPLSRDSVYQAFVRAVNRAGVPHARLHDLRHTRTTELSATVDATQAMTITGHSDPKMFRRYAHTSKEINPKLMQADRERRKIGGTKIQAPSLPSDPASLADALKSLSPKERRKIALQMLSEDLDND
ncbi:TPA: tyrosine-type recombinase/integrase [Stenotrophomonas maltophilia]|nr:site-specific integrase [Stenotrophomonas maltophilia]